MEELIEFFKKEIEHMKGDRTEIILTKEDCEVILKALENGKQ